MEYDITGAMSLIVEVLLSDRGSCSKCSREIRRGEIVFGVERPSRLRVASPTKLMKIVCNDCGGALVELRKEIGRTEPRSPEETAARNRLNDAEDEVVHGKAAG